MPLVELGEVLSGKTAGRVSPDELTAFISLGLAVEDLAAAELALRVATEAGLGRRGAVVIPLASITRARATLAGVALRTPLVRLRLDDAPAEIYLKLECLQPIGSFKIRGALNAMAEAPPGALEHGVVTASAGNMAQGVAWGARERGLPCTVVVPDTAPKTKLDAIERLGGRILPVPFEDWWRAIETSQHPGAEGYFVHPVLDDGVMAGNGTIGLEILEDLPDVDAVLIPWGGGGLTCGIASALSSRSRACA